MSLDKKIVADFIIESRKIVLNLTIILTEIKGQPSLSLKLHDYGNQVDRIMGAAQTLALAMSEEHAFDLISDYSSICKTVAYKAAKLNDNVPFYDLCIALLVDATDTLGFLIDRINTPAEQLKKAVEHTMIERFRWVSQNILQDGSKSSGLEAGKMSQDDVDALLKKMGS